tara:strand:+ start:219 stop:386 length:168 start_codon:yes stop_codon:yes gene_type:complete
MILIKKLGPEVIEFLEASGCIWIEGDVKTYVVNNNWYKPTDTKGEYTLEFLRSRE